MFEAEREAGRGGRGKKMVSHRAQALHSPENTTVYSTL